MNMTQLKEKFFSFLYTLNLRKKFIVFFIHLTISAAIFFGFYFLTAFVWYPDFYFSANDVWFAILTVAFVDVGLGPTMTFVLYKSGKPGLKFDITMIIAMQLSALLWGSWVVYRERPLLTVYHNGSFFCLSSTQVALAKADLSQFSTGKPIPQAFLALPENFEAGELRRIKMEQTVLASNQPNLPPYILGDEFELLQPEQLPDVLAEELDITKVVSQPTYQALWKQFLNDHKVAPHTYAFLPLVCSQIDHIAAIDRKTGHIIDAIPIPSFQTSLKRTLPEKQPIEEENKFN